MLLSEKVLERATKFYTEMEFLCNKGGRVSSKTIHRICKKHGTCTGHFHRMVRLGHITKIGHRAFRFNFVVSSGGNEIKEALLAKAA